MDGKRTSLARDILVLLVIAIALFAVAFTFDMAQAVRAAEAAYQREQNPGGPGGENNPIDITKVRIFWNDRDVTDLISYDSTLASQAIDIEDYPYTLCSEGMKTRVGDQYVEINAPQDMWNIAYFDTPNHHENVDVRDDFFFPIDADQKIGVLWESGEDFIYARNGKEIAKLSFWGLDGAALEGIYADGVKINFPIYGPHLLYCNVEDNYGIVITSGVAFYYW